MEHQPKDQTINQEWFEMKEIRRRDFSSSSWIPLRAVQKIKLSGEVGYSGYEMEFFGCATVAVSIQDKPEAEALKWRDLNVSGSHSPWIDQCEYVPAEVFTSWPMKFRGLNLVLVPNDVSEDRQEWMLNQDLVLALSLIREGDSWLSPRESYLEVARLIRDGEGDCIRLEIRTPHLKDYLCARNMSLRISSYHSREIYSSHRDGITWSGDESVQDSVNVRWEGRLRETLEGGGCPGDTFAVIHISRTDLHEDDDIPVMGPPTDENTRTEVRTGVMQGEPNFQIEGVVYKTEWIEPASLSPRVRGDEHPPTVFFTTDAEGNQQSREGLSDSGRWLWFRPTVIRELLECRGSSLRWGSLQTGVVRCSTDGGVHFGLNAQGLINVFAKDIGILPDWQQRVWAGHGAEPGGRLSSELFTMQVRGCSVDSQSPEDGFREGLDRVREASIAAFGQSILSPHDSFEDILGMCHRFRATDFHGLLSLAKDVARLTSDSFNASVCQSVVAPPKSEKWGGRKSVEKLIASRIGEADARKLMGPLAGIYDLRLADAHLPGSGLPDAVRLVGIPEDEPFVNQGVALLSAASQSIAGLAEVLEKWGDSSTPSS